MNSATFCGRLTKDTEIQTVGSGIEVVKFGLAFDRGIKDKKKTCFVNMTAFGKTAVLINTYFHKGDGIILDADVDVDKYTDKDGKERSSVNFIVTNVTFPPSKKGPAPAEAKPDGLIEMKADEDLPF